MDALVLGIITAVITPTATLIGVWLGSRSSLTAQRELLAAQELRRQQELVSDVVVLGRRMLGLHVVTLPLVVRMDKNDGMDWVNTDSAIEQREIQKDLDQAISKASHTLNDHQLAQQVAELSAVLRIDGNLMTDAAKGTMADGRAVVGAWYQEKKSHLDELENRSWEALRPPDWLNPVSLRSSHTSWWRRILPRK